MIYQSIFTSQNEKAKLFQMVESLSNQSVSNWASKTQQTSGVVTAGCGETSPDLDLLDPVILLDEVLTRIKVSTSVIITAIVPISFHGDDVVMIPKLLLLTARRPSGGHGESDAHQARVRGVHRACMGASANDIYIFY